MNRILMTALVAAAGLGVGCAKKQAETPAAFAFTHSLTLHGSPKAIDDSLTGDISGWWDHSFSDNPYKLYIEARPGGGFYEIFDESGDGVQHAVVTADQRGKLLRCVGPLGLAGHAVEMVCTYSPTPVGVDSTRLTLDVHAAGEIKPEWPAVVEQV